MYRRDSQRAVTYTIVAKETKHPRHHGRRHRRGTIRASTTGRHGISRRRTSTASAKKARCSPAGTGSKAAPPAARRFITGQSPIRTGLTKVGLPGAPMGLSQRKILPSRNCSRPRLRHRAVRQEPLGRPKDEFLPTDHGFDEFFGNLYHLNAEEEPENPDYPKNPEFRKKFGPRGVITVRYGRRQRSRTPAR